MRGYGLPRNKDVECADCVDIQTYGLQSSCSRVPRYGNIKNSVRSSKRKRTARRVWKKLERKRQRRELEKEI